VCVQLKRRQEQLVERYLVEHEVTAPQAEASAIPKRQRRGSRDRRPQE
jgi:hypothetical protein